MLGLLDFTVLSRDKNDMGDLLVRKMLTQQADCLTLLEPNHWRLSENQPEIEFSTTLVVLNSRDTQMAVSPFDESRSLIAFSVKGGSESSVYYALDPVADKAVVFYRRIFAR